MIKGLLIVLLLAKTLGVQAQTRLNELFTLIPGNHYPKNMPHVQAWITNTLSPVFIRDMQFSDNGHSSAKFLSFALTGRAGTLLLPNTGGLRLLSGPGHVAVQYSQELLNYTPFNISTFDYTHLSYFLLARDVLRITPGQMIANTLNFFVETGNTKKNKYDLLIDQMNERLKVKIPYAAEKNVNGLLVVLQQALPGKIEEAIFMTYMQGKNDAETRSNIQAFFNVTRFFRAPVEERLDDMMYPKLQFRYEGIQKLEIPLAALTLPGLKDSLASFRVETCEAKLNYHERQLEIIFTGKLNHPVLMVAPKTIERDKTTDQIIWVKPQYPLTEPTDFSSFRLVITESGIQLFGTSPQGYYYQLLDLPWGS